jgi:hypothetical protein
MSTLNEPVAKRISTLVRMFGATEEEAKVAVVKLRRLIAEEKLSFNDIGTLIENCNGEIEQLKYSDADAKVIFEHGVAKGLAEGARGQAPPEFYDTDGYARWDEIALFCQRNIDRIHNEWELTFINDMAGKMLSFLPSEKQAHKLLGIFVRLGGPFDRRTARFRYRE